MPKRNPDRDPWDRYFTADSLAKKMVEWARVPTGGRVLEPSAGSGSLLRPMRDKGAHITAVEIMPEQISQLHQLTRDWPNPVRIEQADFLQWVPEGSYHLAVMNPPFSDGADGRHVAHAIRCAERVVALVRTNFEHTTGRWHGCMVRARVTRKVVLVRRPPPFGGPGDLNEGPQSDYVILELVRRAERTEVDQTDLVQVEYWL